MSRTHPGLILRLFQLEVPEIVEGVVEIKAIAREPGHRTKIAVAANDTNVDPVGACVGARGSRVRMVVNELRGEKVDIVPYSPDPAEFVMKALSPAKVKEVRIVHETGTAEVVVPDYQLSRGDRQGGAERPPGRPPHRLAGRHQERVAALRGGAEPAAEEEWAAGEWITDESGEMVWQPAEGGEAVSASDAGWGDVETATDGEAEEKPDETMPADAAETAEATAGRGRGRRTDGVGPRGEAPAQATVAEARRGMADAATRRSARPSAPASAAGARPHRPAWCVSPAGPTVRWPSGRAEPGRGAWLCAGLGGLLRRRRAAPCVRPGAAGRGLGARLAWLRGRLLSEGVSTSDGPTGRKLEGVGGA